MRREARWRQGRVCMNHFRTWHGICTAGTVDLNEDLPVSLAKRLSKSVQEAQVTPCQRATAEVIARCRAIRDAEVSNACCARRQLGLLSGVGPAASSGARINSTAASIRGRIHVRVTTANGCLLLVLEGSSTAPQTAIRRSQTAAGGSDHLNQRAIRRQASCVIVTSAI